MKPIRKKFTLNEEPTYLKVVRDEPTNADHLSAEELDYDYTEKEKMLARLRIEQTFEVISTINKDLTDSINYAKHIQNAILPEPEILSEFASDSFVMYKPKSIVSGDFYWYMKYDDKLLVAVVDCTGHGVPGAFMSMIGHNLLNEIVHVKDIIQPAEILSRLDRSLRRLLKQDKQLTVSRDGMDISMCLIDRANNVMDFAGANRGIYLMRKNELRSVRGDKFPIGGMFKEEETHYTNHRISISKGDYLYLYTDGYADQFGGGNDKKLMGRRFKQLLKVVTPLHANQQKKIITRFLEEWQGSTIQTDDVLILGLRI